MTEKISSFWNMTNEDRRRSENKLTYYTYYKVSGRVSVQTGPGQGFNQEMVMHTWAVDSNEALGKVLSETVSFYQRAYPDKVLKAKFSNGGPNITIPGEDQNENDLQKNRLRHEYERATFLY